MKLLPAAVAATALPPPLSADPGQAVWAQAPRGVGGVGTGLRCGPRSGRP
jgi:hypothetical protein